MFQRGYRGSRRRSGPRPVIKSFKKVIFRISASFSAGFATEQIAIGVDALAPGQVSVTDPNVPTGSIIKYIEVQFAATNVVSTPCFINCTLQYLVAGQAVINPNAVGGSNQRNQVLHMDMFTIGANQNSTHKFKFKIPKKFQRLRAGMEWQLAWTNSATVNRQMQAIYKFYS